MHPIPLRTFPGARHPVRAGEIADLFLPRILPGRLDGTEQHVKQPGRSITGHGAMHHRPEVNCMRLCTSRLNASTELPSVH